MNEKIEKLIDTSLADKFQDVYAKYAEYTEKSNILRAKYEESDKILKDEYATVINTYDILMAAKEAIANGIGGAKQA